MHWQLGGLPVQVSSGSAQRVPAVQVPPQPSDGVLPQARVAGAVQVGAQQPAPVQRWPAAHMVPLGHAGQPAGSLGSKPHESALASSHRGQHAPPMQLEPEAHCVPVAQVRQTSPRPLSWSGMGTPQATELGLGQLGQQEPSVQLSPAGHCVPTPQSRQSVPPLKTSGTSCPQATVLRPAQPPQQTRLAWPEVPGGLRQLWPEGQLRPHPLQLRQALSGISVPQATLLRPGQFWQHTPAEPPVQLWPPLHPLVP